MYIAYGFFARCLKLHFWNRSLSLVMFRGLYDLHDNESYSLDENNRNSLRTLIGIFIRKQYVQYSNGICYTTL